MVGNRKIIMLRKDAIDYVHNYDVQDVNALITSIFKGKVSREFDVISKPKNVCLSTETKHNCLVLL